MCVSENVSEGLLSWNILFGRSEGQVWYWICLGVVLFVVMFSLHSPVTASVFSSFGIPTGFVVNIGVFAPLVLVFSVLGGYLDKGILASFLLAAGLCLGAYLPSAIFDSPDFPVPLIPTLQWALTIAFVIGCIGFVVGAGVKRLLS